MTTDTRDALGGRVGALRFQGYLGAIVAVFGLLYALQTLDALVAGWPTMAGTAGGAAVALVGGSVLLGCVAGIASTRARGLFLGAAALFCVAVAIWPFSLSGAVPGTPMPWLIGLMPVQAAYLAVAFRRVAASLCCVLLLIAVVAAVLVVRGGVDPAEALTDALFAVAISAVLVVMITAVRRGVRRADAAQAAALAGYGRTRLDDATESERVRTDALVHDSVLTTFLAAAAAHEPESEELARRMAANALRVLAHVTRSGAVGPASPFTRSLHDAVERFDPVITGWDVEVGTVTDLVLPEAAGTTIVEAMLLAMAGSVQHAEGAVTRTLRMQELGPDGIRIVLTDDGRGFDPGSGDERCGMLREIGALMRSVDGRADVRTAPASGTVVSLSWGSVVVTAAAPEAERSEVLA